MTTEAGPKYALGYQEDETARLAQQARILDDLTEDFLVKAGIAPGMRVLDCGSGAGHVTAIAARIVGPSGQVVGVDRNAAAFEDVRVRLRQDGLSNVELVQAELPDVSDVPGYGSFDAIIGRLVLLYLGDPAAAIATLLNAARPTGIIAFQEIAISKAFTQPPCPSVEIARDVLGSAFGAAGADPDCGLKLDRAFRRSGLQPRFVATAAIEGAHDAGIAAWIAATLRSLAPVIERLELPRSFDLSSIASQMRLEIEENEATVLGPLIIGAFARRS